MVTYVYETIPTAEGERPKQVEIRQSMSEAALTHHPETGEPIRRVIRGGYGYIPKGGNEAQGGPRCGRGGCGCS